MTISAKVIADSISALTGTRIITFELEYPRFIHAEFMTHRLFSRNAASSRAIPVKKSIELLRENTARPIHWGKNQPGMSAKEECESPIHLTPGAEFATTRQAAWNYARDRAIEVAEAYADSGYHKQIVNRLLEPFSHIKVVCTATDYTNFYWLRRHKDAQPEIQELANKMWEAQQASTPHDLKNGEWHVPYYKNGYWKPSGFVNITTHDIVDLDAKLGGVSLQDALMISSSQCAQVSYRKTDDTLEKAKIIWDRLVSSEPVHASPFEHQATPVPYVETVTHGSLVHGWQDGITHQDRHNRAWSGNLKDWIQHRQLIPGNAMNEGVSQ